ncbi:polysialyltransferase family glycosyltransferase [Aeromonas media]|uniref:polysialyltransferase family glycosyltransferase n=1 Tax=Aeromonas media TaxID=651 RepID=UPI003D04846E
MMIALVESPLQLLNAFEATLFFNNKKTIYFVRLSGEYKNDNQMIFLAQSLRLKNVVKIIVPVNKSDFYVLFKIMFLKVSIWGASFFSSRIIIGNFDSRLIRFVLAKAHQGKFLLVDDGAKSLSQQSGFSDNHNVDFFSIYELSAWKGQNVFLNEYNGLRTLLSDKKCKMHEGKVLFLGAKLSEANIVEERQYLKYIAQIQEFYRDDSLELIYIPHRGESLEKIQDIKSLFDIKIMELDFPIELIGLYQNELPYKVASFYSTALYSLNKIYGVDVDCFEFDCSGLSNYDAIKAVYDLYRKHYRVIALRE